MARMDEAELASLLRAALPTMAPVAVAALVRSIFDAFRDRGESSEDAAEGANAALDALEAGDLAAVGALVAYARENTGLLKESMTLYAEQHPSALSALPPALLDGIRERLSQ
ncbi:MAG: hypothetical protein KGN02_06855 [bacterium]|nr:hypothetical protein [bacterium]